MSDETRDRGPAPDAEDPSSGNDYREQLLRMRADFENAKKRLERDRQDAVRFANERLLVEILHIVDTFDRAMASLAEGHDPSSVRKGLEIAQAELHAILEKHGVKPVQAPAGTPFDPNVHEAVGEVERKGLKEGTVADEVQRGYVLNGRLIRPSRVTLAK